MKSTLLVFAALALVAAGATRSEAQCARFSDFPRVTAVVSGVAPEELSPLDPQHLVGLEGGDMVLLTATQPPAIDDVARLTVNPAGDLEELALVGSLAYCRDANTGLIHAVDLADFAQPVLLGIAIIPGAPYALGGGAGLLGGVTSNAGWSLYDCANPLAPTIVSSLAETFGCTDIAILGDQALILGSGWMLYDLQTPAAPVLRGGEDYPYYNSPDYAAGEWVTHGLVTNDRLVLLIDDSQRWGQWIYGDVHFRHDLGLRVLDVSDPANPVITGEAEIGFSTALPNLLVSSLDIAGDLVFAQGGDAPIIWNYDLTSDLSLPLQAFNPGVFAGGMLAASGALLVGAADVTATFTYDLPPHDNVWPAPLPVDEPSRSVSESVVGDQWLGVSTSWWDEYSGGCRVEIYQPDVSLTSIQANIDGSGLIRDLAAAGARLYVVDDGHLKWSNLTNPASPTALQPIPIAQSLISVDCGPHGFVAVGREAGGVDLYGLNNPASPNLLDTVPDIVATALFWADSRLFAATATGVTTIDVSDPEAAVVLGSVALGPCTWLSDAGLTQVFAGNAGLIAVVDAPADGAPTVHAMTAYPGPITGVVAAGNDVYVSNGGVSLLRATDLSMVGELVPMSPVGYLAEWYGQLLGCLLDLPGLVQLPPACDPETAVDDGTPATPAAAPVVSAQPNPFNPRTEIRFALADNRQVRLAAYDARGREVRLLIDGQLAAGDHRLVWDGRDDAGRKLPSGTYLLRLAAGGAVSATKVLLMQ